MAKKPHVWVTRPLEHAVRTQRDLEHLGFRVTVDPLMRYQPVPCEEIASLLDQAGVWVVSSAYAIECLARLTPQRSKPLWVVGRYSQKYAQSLGFQTVHYGGINQNALVETLQGRVHPQQAPILYLSGTATHGQTHQMLAERGYAVSHATLYTTEPAPLKNETLSLLRDGGLDGVVFFSQQAAQNFCHNVEDLSYTLCNDLDVFALSERVLNPVLKQGWRTHHVSSLPSWSSLLHLIRSYYHGFQSP